MVCNIRQYGTICLSMLTNARVCVKDVREAFEIIMFNAEFVEYPEMVKGSGGRPTYLKRIRDAVLSSRDKDPSSSEKHGLDGTKSSKGIINVRKDLKNDEEKLICEKDEDDDQDKSTSFEEATASGKSGRGGGEMLEVAKKEQSKSNDTANRVGNILLSLQLKSHKSGKGSCKES